MSIQLADRIWQTCLSSLQLDRFLQGELAGAEKEELRAHLVNCPPCSAVLAQRQAAEREPLPALRLLPASHPVTSLARVRRLRPLRSSGVFAGLAGLAAAASLLLVFSQRPPGSRAGARSKGAAVALSMYVQHGTEVRRAGPGEQVAAGDAVRFAVSLPADAFVAVLSRDPRGRGSIYFPTGPRAELVPAGADVPLRLSTRLDGTVGEEELAALFCTAPVALEPVRAALESGTALIPKGCEVSRWSFVKK